LTSYITRVKTVYCLIRKLFSPIDGKHLDPVGALGGAEIGTVFWNWLKESLFEDCGLDQKCRIC
jgi:hypothetical protein